MTPRICRSLSLVSIVLAVAACAPQATPASRTVMASLPPATAVRYPMADCHLHLVDFLQRTDGINAALAAMDRCGVSDAVVSGMPVVKAWSESESIRPD